MFRDKLKELGRKAAIRAFGMEHDAAPRDNQNQKVTPPTAIDPGVIPRIVDGSGDTPGPNHRTNLGRTWLAAQLVSGVAPMLIDLRHPKECAGGILQGAVLLPARQVESAALPAKDTRIVVYDQLGSPECAAVAQWLRDQGWEGARMLVGGYAEWIEHDEPIAVPQPPPGGRYHIGTMVERKVGGRAYVQAASAPGGTPCYTLYQEDGTAIGPVGEGDLAP